MLAGPLLAAPAKVEAYADSVASLIDPAKLATLGVRQANPRVEKYVALLADAKAEGVKPGQITTRALALVGMKGAAAKLTHQAMLRNLVIAERLGCLDEAGLAEMRKGLGATIHRGPYAGEKASVDHIIPLKVVPELDHVIANLELMPLRLNEKKNAQVGRRQRSLARKLHDAGLLSQGGLDAVIANVTRELRSTAAGVLLSIEIVTGRLERILLMGYFTTMNDEKIVLKPEDTEVLRKALASSLAEAPATTKRLIQEDHIRRANPQKEEHTDAMVF